MTTEMSYHSPVLLHPSIDGLNIRSNGVYVDVTFGGGGHSREILNRLGTNGKLFAFDQDEDALANVINDKRFILIPENFRFIKRFLKFHGVAKVDGILADLGVSSHQFDDASRGFSTRFEEVLDMRMSKKNKLSAGTILNEYDENELRFLLQTYGELKSAAGMAYAIVNFRKTQPIQHTGHLKEALARFLPNNKTHKILAQVYQAFRIEVNQELQVLQEFLQQTLDLLPKGGRLSVISYHSLEDRLVKRFMRNGLFEGEPQRDIFGNFEVPFRSIEKLLVPNDDEITENNRARSAKLRIAERI